MNPSSAGWIDKYIFILGKSNAIFPYKNKKEFYTALRETGFLYGFSVKPLFSEKISDISLTEGELAKLNLLHSLLYIYSERNGDDDFEKAIGEINFFYKKIGKKKRSWLQKLTLSRKPAKQLEQILASRMAKNEVLEKQLFNHVITQALSFMDILAFDRYLSGEEAISEYMVSMESSIINTCFLALSSKINKSKYDLLLLDLFEATSAYFPKENALRKVQDTELFHKEIEKNYLQDLCCLAVWSDLQLEKTEIQFLRELSESLELEEEDLQESLNSLEIFAEKNKMKLSLFNYTHPVKEFYKESSKTVKLLILRNKNRLLQELSQSRELLVLLGNSTYRELDKNEKVKVKEQLLDICKAVPSLTIFLLPGGSLLLPLLIKFIPKLLPSAFDDNKIPKA